MRHIWLDVLIVTCDGPLEVERALDAAYILNEVLARVLRPETEGIDVIRTEVDTLRSETAIDEDIAPF